MAGTIDTIFADNPFGDLHMLERAPTYVPQLLATYKRAMKWHRFVGAQINFNAMTSRQMVLTRPIQGEPDFSAKTEKTLFFPQGTFLGLERKTVDIEYHYDKITWHDDDQLFNFTNVPLDTLARGELGENMAKYFDYLARNSALGSVYAKYANSGSDFSALTAATHKFELEWVGDILLGMEYENVVDAELGVISCACMTTPGVIRDIVSTVGSEYKAINSFSEEGRAALMQYGIHGLYMGVGWIPTLANVLWGCGPITAQGPIVEPMETLDGVADGANNQGWDAAQDGAKEYIQLDSASWGTGAITDIAAGDVVVIHKTRGNTYGVANGVLPTEGTADWRTVASVDNGNFRIALFKPWLKDGYSTALAAGNYGWVTKADHVHMSSFVADIQALQMGVAQTPELHEPPVIDDAMKKHRVTWDFHGAMELMNHQGLRNVFTRGSYTAGHGYMDVNA